MAFLGKGFSLHYLSPLKSYYYGHLMRTHYIYRPRWLWKVSLFYLRRRGLYSLYHFLFSYDDRIQSYTKYVHMLGSDEIIKNFNLFHDYTYPTLNFKDNTTSFANLLEETDTWVWYITSKWLISVCYTYWTLIILIDTTLCFMPTLKP